MTAMMMRRVQTQVLDPTYVLVMKVLQATGKRVKVSCQRPYEFQCSGKILIFSLAINLISIRDEIDQQLFSFTIIYKFKPI